MLSRVRATNGGRVGAVGIGHGERVRLALAKGGRRYQVGRGDLGRHHAGVLHALGDGAHQGGRATDDKVGKVKAQLEALIK